MILYYLCLQVYGKYESNATKHPLDWSLLFVYAMEFYIQAIVH
jgi:hypothetical protein